MISPISFGATVSILLTTAHAIALPQVAPPVQTPQVQPPPPVVQQQPQPFSSFTAAVFSAMRNSPSDPAGVLISLPFQTTTVTVTVPPSTVTISQCFTGIATPIPAPPLSQPGNGLIGQPSIPVATGAPAIVTPAGAPPVAAIPTPTVVAPGVFPAGFPSNGGLLPFLPSGTGSGFNPLASGGFISAVLPAIQSSVALEVASILGPQFQPTSPALPTPPALQNPTNVQTQGVVGQNPPVGQQTQNAQQVTVTAQIPVPTTVLNTVQVPTTVVNTVLNTVQVTNTVQQVQTITLPGNPTTVTLQATNTPVAFSSPVVAPFPFPSGGVNSGFASGTGVLPTGVLPTGAFPTGSFATGTALAPVGTPSASAFIPQGTAPVPTAAGPLGTAPVVPVATPLPTPQPSGLPQVGTNQQQQGPPSPLSALPGTSFGQAGQPGTVFRRHARDFVAHHMINA